MPYCGRRRIAISRTAKITIELVLSTALTAAVAVALLAWRLTTGPISLNFLTPLIEQALDVSGDGVTVHIDDTVLEWTAGSGGLPEFRVRGLHVLSPQGDLIAEAPAAAIRLSITALLSGRLAPTRIDLIGPQITLERSADGIRLLHYGGASPERSAEGGGGERSSILGLLLPELGGRGEGSREGGHGADGMLREMAQVGVIGAALTLEDRVTGRTWFAPSADIVIARTPGGLRARLAVTLEVVGRTARIEGNAALALDTGRIELSVVLPRLEAGMVAMADPALARVAALHAEISGQIDMTVDVARGVRAVRVDLATGPGLIVDPATFPEPIGYGGLRLRAESADDMARVTFDVALQDVMGSTLTASGRIDDATTAPVLSLNAEARNVVADDLARLWPVNAGPGAREWTTTHISDGRVEQGMLELVARAPTEAGGDVVIERLDARMRFVGLTIDYRSPMTPVRGVNGTAQFSASRAVFEVTSGSVTGLRVDSGTIVLEGIDAPGSTAAIDLNIRGPARDALTLIDSPPLGFVRKMNRAPGDFSGAATTRLQIRFPLIQRLTLDEVQVTASGTVTAFQMRHVALEQDIRGGTINFQVDDRALQINGQVQFGPVAAEIELTQHFHANAPFAMRTRARGRVTPNDLVTLRLDPRPWVEGGTIAADVLITMNRNRRDDIVIDAVLDDAQMQIAALDWSKPVGTRGTARIEIGLVNERASELRAFRLLAPGIEARGGGAFSPDGRALRTLRADQVIAGRTRARAVITFEDRAISIEAAGPSFDLGGVLRDRRPPRSDAPLFAIRAEIDRVFIDETRAIERVRFNGRRSGSRWLSADLEASPRADGTPLLRASVRTESTGRRTLNASSPDFGALAAVIGLSPNIRGGRLEITGSTDENREAKPLVGRVEARDFRILNAPLLARILGVAFLTGIGDALRGEGISFTQLDGQFEHDGSRLTMRNWHAYGSAIGMTATGTLNFDDGVVAIEGIVVPANAINSVVSNIPVIGHIFAGGPGGGIFAANYSATGPLRDPRVSVNMLSALTPGFLRNLFRGATPGSVAPAESPTNQ